MPSSSAACCPAAPAPSCAAGSVLPSAAVGTGTFPMTLVAASSTAGVSTPSDTASPAKEAVSVAPAASAATASSATSVPGTSPLAPAAEPITASPSATPLYSAACRSAPGSMPCTASRSPVSGSPAPSPASSHCISRSCASCSFIIRPDSCPLSGIRPAFCSLLWPFHRHIQRSRHYIRYRPDHVMRGYAQGSMSSPPQAMSIVTASPSQPRCRHGRATKRTVAGESRATCINCPIIA